MIVSQMISTASITNKPQVITSTTAAPVITKTSSSDPELKFVNDTDDLEDDDDDDRDSDEDGTLSIISLDFSLSKYDF